MPDSRLYTILCLTGALPFVAAALLPFIGYDRVGQFGGTVDFALSYGLVIVCFLAGAHWATDLYEKSSLRLNLLLASNVIVLGVWFPYMFAPASVTIVALMLAFAWLLYVDYRLLAANAIDSGYFRLRAIATAVAMVSLLVIVVGL